MTHFLCLNDFSKEQIRDLLSLSLELKSSRQNSSKALSGKTLAMILQKKSMRTRISFEVAMNQLGGRAINILPSEIGFGAREPISDIAKVVSRYVDAVMIRANSHDDIVEFSQNSRVPVINGLCNKYHPCQAVADVLTIEEKKGNISNLKVCYIGDGNNVCESLINISNKLDFELNIATPKGYEPNSKQKNGNIYNTPKDAAKDADVIYTDTWTSMGQEEENEKRLTDFRDFSINIELMNQAKGDAIFMHCLPAYRGQEVTQEVMDGKQSVVFDQAENRLHAQKAILLTLIGN